MTTTSSRTATVPYAELAATLRGDADQPGGSRIRRGAGRLQRHDRQAPGRDRRAAATPPTSSPACGSPASTAPRSRCAAAATTRPASGWRTTRWSSTCRCCAAPRSAREDHTVRVDAGCTWGDVDHATVAFGMATPSGFLASTGVAGLTLGGGIGYLSRRFGLTVDNLLAADVVLADGTFVTASENSHPDLFWALRGGGGNFGIVTSFTFRCHDIGEHGSIIGGPVLYDIADTPEVMRWYRELLPSLPEELSGWIGLLTIPPAPPFPEALWGRKACGIVWCYTGPHDRADEVLEPVEDVRLAAAGRPAGDAVHRAAERVRPAVPGRAAVVLAGGLLQRDLRRRDRRAPQVRRRGCPPATPPCTCTRSTARPAGCPPTRPRSPTATAAGPASSSASTPDPANAGRHLPVGQGLLGGTAPDLSRRRVHQLHDGRGPGPGESRPTAATTTGSPRSSAATTRTTSSTSTRTSSPPAGPDAKPAQPPAGTCWSGACAGLAGGGCADRRPVPLRGSRCHDPSCS